MSVKEQYWKYSLITIILGLGLILVKKRLISLICICIFESNYGLCI